MLDALQVLSWSAAYVFIIVAGTKNLYDKDKRTAMPYIAGVCNFAWELCALCYSKGLWAHILWFGLDTVIFFLNFRTLSFRNQKILYLLSFVCTVCICVMLFRAQQGMLLTVFSIDLIMAVSFIKYQKTVSRYFKVTIATLKLMGDLFAVLYYYEQSTIIAIIAFAVLMINSIYLVMCYRDKKVMI